MLFFLTDSYPEEWAFIPLPALEQDDEPAGDFICRFPSGVAGRVLTSGLKKNLLVEADVVGECGRIRVLGNGEIAIKQDFLPSGAYMGYQVLGSKSCLYESAKGESAIVTLLEEVSRVVQGDCKPSSNGESTTESEDILGRLASVYYGRDTYVQK